MQLFGFALALTVLLLVLGALFLLLGWPAFLIAVAIGLAILVATDGAGGLVGRTRKSSD